MSFSSRIQVLKVDAPEVKKSPKDGSEYTVYSAQTALLDDKGDILKVGRLRIPEKMRDQVTVGVHRATFGLEVAQWGQNKGDVIASLLGLMPESPKKA